MDSNIEASVDTESLGEGQAKFNCVVWGVMACGFAFVVRLHSVHGETVWQIVGIPEKHMYISHK